MPKKLIVILMLCCFFMGCEHSDNCASNNKAIFKVGDKVSLRVTGDTGTIHRVSKKGKGGCNAPIYSYHVKIFSKTEKGYVVHRMAEENILEFIEQER